MIMKNTKVIFKSSFRYLLLIFNAIVVHRHEA